MKPRLVQLAVAVLLAAMCAAPAPQLRAQTATPATPTLPPATLTASPVPSATAIATATATATSLSPTPPLATPLPTTPPPTASGYPPPTATVPPPAATATSGATAVTITPGAGSPSAPAAQGVLHEERPIIVVKDYNVDPDRPAAGSTFHLRLHVANVGEHFAENIELAMSGEGLQPVDKGATRYVGNLSEGDDTDVDVQIQAAPSLADGVYALAIAISWDDSYGQSYSGSTSIGIAVAGAGADRPSVVLTGSSVPSRVASGVPFAVTLELANTGGREARDVVVSPTGPPLALAGSGAGGPVTIPAGGRATMNLRLVAGAVAQPGAVSQSLEIRYDGPDGQRYTDAQSIGLIVLGDTPFGAVPIVTGYRARLQDGDEVTTLHPGDLFDLELTVQNVGVEPALRTRLTLGSGVSSSGSVAPALGAFAPVGSGNVAFLDTLRPGEDRVVRQSMVVDGGAASGAYTLQVSFSYVDGQGAPQETAEVISLLVGQEVLIDINPLNPVESLVVGPSVPFSVEIVNASADTVDLGEAAITGDAYIEVTDGSRFIGSLDAGSIDVLDASLLPKEPGRSTVTVSIRYRDDFNRPGTVEKTFTIAVEAQPTPTAPGPESVGGGGSSNIVIRILKGLLGLGASGPTVAPADVPGEPGAVPARSDSAGPSGGASTTEGAIAAPAEAP